MTTTDVLIAGAGPAGLAVAGRLAKAGIPFLLLEKGDRVAQTWRGHYDRLCLHTIKEHSNLPFLELPEQYPNYVPRLDMIAYWEEYVQKMNLSPLFGHTVLNIRRDGEEWLTTTNTGLFRSRYVVVATGYNRVPHLPVWEGQEHFKGTFLHSRQYRNAMPFVGKKVLIVGIGNTGAEIALDLQENGAFPSISVRGPVNFIRRDIAGRPTQQTAILLGKLPAPIYDIIARQVQKWTVGDLTAYGLPPSPYAPSEQLRRFGKVPVIDIGTIESIKQGKIKILPGIQSFSENSVTFKNGATESFDAVIACTGYRPQLDDFLENASSMFDEKGYVPRLWLEEPAWKDLYFCGFNLPLGGHLRNFKLDSEAIVRHIQSKNRLG